MVKNTANQLHQLLKNKISVKLTMPMLKVKFNGLEPNLGDHFLRPIEIALVGMSQWHFGFVA